jgi:hypothetical protein
VIAAPISRVLAFAVLFAMGAAVTPARAQTMWTDATGSWFVPGNWSAGAPPNAGGTIVGNGGTAQINLPGASAGPTLTIAGGSTVDLQTGGALTATSSITLSNAGTLLLSGSTAVTGNIDFLGNPGGTLRATTAGTLTNNITFEANTNSTVAAGAGQTLTLANNLAFNGPIAAMTTVNFGSPTDTGPSSCHPRLYPLFPFLLSAWRAARWGSSVRLASSCSLSHRRSPSTPARRWTTPASPA